MIVFLLLVIVAILLFGAGALLRGAAALFQAGAAVLAVAFVFALFRGLPPWLWITLAVLCGVLILGIIGGLVWAESEISKQDAAREAEADQELRDQGFSENEITRRRDHRRAVQDEHRKRSAEVLATQRAKK